VNPRSRPPGRETTARQIAHLLRAFGTWILEPERLPHSPVEPRRRAPAPGFTPWPEDRQPLPFLADETPPRKQFFSWLASSEPMPDAATAHEPSRESILGWLCSSEQLTTDQPTRPTKEVSIHGS
jgi:hypothetical protein